MSCEFSVKADHPVSKALQTHLIFISLSHMTKRSAAFCVLTRKEKYFKSKMQKKSQNQSSFSA